MSNIGATLENLCFQKTVTSIAGITLGSNHNLWLAPSQGKCMHLEQEIRSQLKINKSMARCSTTVPEAKEWTPKGY